MTYKDEILQTLFGGGTADYAMLEKCNYDFEDEEEWESGSLSQAEYDEYDRLQTERNDLESICVYDDIEYFVNYIDTHISINDETTKEVYRNYLKDFVDEENKNIGFVYLDLD